VSQVGIIAAGLRDALETAAPLRTVTRTLVMFSDREDEALLDGVYTLLVTGLSGAERYRRFVDLMLVGQIKVDEEESGEKLEEAELLMIDEILAFQSGLNVNFSFESIASSRQIEAPYGWVSVKGTVGPFDLCQPIDASTIGDFITFHAETDLGGNADNPAMITETTLPQ